MARPRTPLLKATATGRVLHDPKRFRHRKEPLVLDPLGDAPKWMKDRFQIEAWETFKKEVPWLNRSHRTLVSIASNIRGRLTAGEKLSVSALNLLRIILGQMGATPVDSSKISLPDEKEPEDASKRYF